MRPVQYILRTKTLNDYGMSANGSFASRSTNSDLGRNYKTIGTVGQIQVVTPKILKLVLSCPKRVIPPIKCTQHFIKMGMM